MWHAPRVGDGPGGSSCEKRGVLFRGRGNTLVFEGGQKVGDQTTNFYSLVLRMVSLYYIRVSIVRG